MANNFNRLLDAIIKRISPRVRALNTFADALLKVIAQGKKDEPLVFSDARNVEVMEWFNERETTMQRTTPQYFFEPKRPPSPTIQPTSAAAKDSQQDTPPNDKSHLIITAQT